MAATGSRSAQREQRLNEVLADYLEAIENGRAPERAALLAAHPDLADDLASFLDNRQQLQPRADNLPEPTVVGAEAPLFSLGDYDLLSEIARGGMGIVYRARQRSLNRIVAIKTIRPELADAEGRQRFLTEAEAIGRLDDPHIVTIYEFGEADQLLYFSMQYLSGGNLSQWVERQGWTSGQRQSRRLFRKRQLLVASLLARVARAVQHAHDQGVLHRDLKPANILLMGEPAPSGAGEPEPEPVVTDFGLAKVFRRASQITQSMSIVGTASYMAPEQAFPDRFPLTVAADVYSMGAILYFLLVGRPPFVGETPFDTLLKAVEEPPVPLRKIDSRIDAALEKIVLRCLSKNPADRYPSAAALAQDLENWRHGDPVAVSPPTRLGRLRHWFRRRPVAAGMVLASFLSLVLLAGALSLGVVKIAAERDQAALRADTERELREQVEKQAERVRDLLEESKDTTLTLLSSLEREQQLRENNNQLLARLYVGQGMQQLEAGDPTVALVWLTEALQLQTRQPRGEAVERLRIGGALQRCPRLIQTWFPDSPVETVLVSPEGRQIVLVFPDRTVQVGQTTSGIVKSLPDKAQFAVAAAGQPLLARLDETDHVRLWDLAADRPWPWQPGPKKVQQLAVSPDGKRLALAGTDNMVRVWDTASGKAVGPALKHSSRIFQLAFSPEGRSLMTASGMSAEGEIEVRIWAVNAPGTPITLRAPLGIRLHWMRSLAFSPDGSRVLMVANQGLARLFDALTGKLLGKAPTHLGGRTSEILGQDGSTILVAEGPRLLQRDLVNDLPVGPVLAHVGKVQSAAYSADGRKIVTVASGTVRVWNAITGEPLTPPLRTEARITDARLSNTGQRLVVLSAEPAVRIYDLTPRYEAIVEASAGRIGSIVALSPEGRQRLLKREDGTLLLGDGKSTRSLRGDSKAVGNQAVFSRDGRWLATAGDRTVRIWETRTAQPVSPLLKLTSAPRQLTFAPDRQELLVLDDGNEFHRWGLDGKEIQTGKLPAASRQGMRQLSADARFVASVRDNRLIEVRELATGEQPGPTLRGLSAVSRLTFRDDGELLLAGFNDGNVGLWRTATGEPVQLSLHHPRPVRLAAFGPAPLLLLATAQDDGTVNVWDVDSGLPVTPPLHHHGPLVEILFGKDGDVLLTRGKSGTVTRWPLPSDNRSPDELVWIARALAGQRLLPHSGGLAPTDPGSFKDLWPQLRRDFPREFSTSD